MGRTAAPHSHFPPAVNVALPLLHTHSLWGQQSLATASSQTVFDWKVKFTSSLVEAFEIVGKTILF